MKLTILGVTFEASDKVLYAKDAKEYIHAIKQGKGLAKKVLKSYPIS